MRPVKEIEYELSQVISAIADLKLTMLAKRSEVKKLQKELSKANRVIRKATSDYAIASTLPADSLAIAEYANEKLSGVCKPEVFRRDVRLQRDLYLVGRYLQGLNFQQAADSVKCSLFISMRAFRRLTNRAISMLAHSGPAGALVAIENFHPGMAPCSQPLVIRCREEFAKGNK